jgi:GMP synthase (glutamine-hydrolysing)
MRVLSISHQRDAGPGVFADAVADAGAEHEEWLIAESSEPPADPVGYDAVMVFGGAMNADQEDFYGWLAPEKQLLADLLARRVPLLGVCLGAQLLVEAAGGEARPAREPEIGWIEVEVTPQGSADPLLAPLGRRFEAFSWHSYECALPADATVLARSPVCAQAYRLAGAPAWGIQFHAEVSPADATHWIDDYRADPDAVRIGLDPGALRAETEAKLAAHNELGRGLCARFLAAASNSSTTWRS